MRLLIGIGLSSLLSATIVRADVPAPSVAATAAANKVVCRSRPEMGSLVKRHRTCLTKSQWKYVQEQNETLARRTLQDGTGRVGCQIQAEGGKYDIGTQFC